VTLNLNEAMTFDEIDWRIADFMDRWGTLSLRVSLGVIFIWFGILKPLGLSAAEPLVLATVGWLPVLEPVQWLMVIGWWEVVIGICFLFRGMIRVAIALLLLQLGGTFMPLVMLPEITFQQGRVPWLPTMEGQYIIKNLLILSAALVVGGTVRGRGRGAGAARTASAGRPASTAGPGRAAEPASTLWPASAAEPANAPQPASASPHARPAPTDHPIDPLIGNRWSPRAFDPRPVEPELLCSLFEAARWAPSSFNDQPWFFLVATRDNPEWHECLGSFLNEGNDWARRAPVLIASAHRTVLTRNGKQNRVAARDLGAAEENLCLQAFASGLVAHQMGGFDHERLAAELLPDEDHAPCCMIAIGYPGDPALLPEKLREREGRERRREPLGEFVFGERWGEPAGFVPKG